VLRTDQLGTDRGAHGRRAPAVEAAGHAGGEVPPAIAQPVVNSETFRGSPHFRLSHPRATVVIHTDTSVVTIERYIIEQERRFPDATGDLSGILYDLALAAR
jgi:hypothetical protein